MNMATSIREGLAAQLEEQLQELQADKSAIDDAIRTLRDSIRELRGARRTDVGPPSKHTRRRRHPVLAPPGTVPILTARGAHNEKAVLDYLDGQSDLVAFRSIYEGLDMNSGTASGVLERLVKAGLVERTSFNAYRITEVGRETLAKVNRLEANIANTEPNGAEPEPEATPEPEAKPKPKKRSKPRDTRTTEEKYAAVDNTLRNAQGRLSIEELVKRVGTFKGWLREHREEMQRRGILEVVRVEDANVPVGYRVYFRTPQHRETVVKPGEGVAPGAGRRLPWA
jgi:predicted transcriptional regulator